MGRSQNDVEVRATVGSRIKQVRRETRMTQEAAAEELDMALSNYQRIESGIGAPTIGRLVDIARLYKVSVDWLLGLTEASTPLWVTD